MYEFAYHLIQQGNIQGAIEITGQQLEKDPDDAHATALRGMALWVGGDRNAGRELMTRALELEPEDPSILALNGWYLAELDRSEEAVEKLEAAHRLDPEEANHCQVMAEVWERNQRWEDALKWGEHAAALEPDAIRLAALSYYRAMNGQIEDGETALANALELDGNDAVVHAYAGMYWLAVGDSDTAREHFRISIQLNPIHPKTRLLFVQSKFGGKFFASLLKLQNWIGRTGSAVGLATFLFMLATVLSALVGLLFSGAASVAKYCGIAFVFCILLIEIPFQATNVLLLFNRMGRELLLNSPFFLDRRWCLRMTCLVGLVTLFWKVDFDRAWHLLLLTLGTIAAVASTMSYSPKAPPLDHADCEVEDPE